MQNLRNHQRLICLPFCAILDWVWRYIGSSNLNFVIQMKTWVTHFLILVISSLISRVGDAKQDSWPVLDSYLYLWLVLGICGWYSLTCYGGKTKICICDPCVVFSIPLNPSSLLFSFSTSTKYIAASWKRPPRGYRGRRFRPRALLSTSSAPTTSCRLSFISSTPRACPSACPRRPLANASRSPNPRVLCVPWQGSETSVWSFFETFLSSQVSITFFSLVIVPTHNVDYRWINEIKNSSVGATSWYHCIAEDSRIPKMPVINPLQALVHLQTQKLSYRDCQSPAPTSHNLPILVNRSAD